MRALTTTSLTLASLLLGSPAFAQSPAQICIDHHAEAQEARADNRWHSARGALLECAKASCPGVIAGDCTRWLDELDQQMPSVVLVVRRGGTDVTGASVTLDDKAIALGTELDVDPGEHTIIVTVDGDPPRTEKVRVSPGEKSRLVHVDLPLRPQDSPPAEAAVPMHRPVPTITWLLGGGAVLFAAAGTGFGVAALNEHDKLAKPIADGGCSPVCTSAQVSTLDTLATVSDIAFGAAILSAVGAGVTYLLRPEVPVEEPKPSAVNWSVSPLGAFVSYGGDF